jgi:N-acetylornithine carbamoyltransferase
MAKRDFLGFQGWKTEELRALVARAQDLRAGRVRGSLEGRIVALYFMNPSLRTRASMESACVRLGAKAITLDAGAGGVWGLEHRDGVKMDGTAAEHVREAAPVLARYADAIGVRAFPKLEQWADDKAEPMLNAFARFAGKPVISLEGSSRHPLQALADAQTLLDRHPRGKKKFVVTWAPHPKPLPMSVPNSAIEAGALAGMDVVLAHPPGFELDPEVVSGAAALARDTGGSVTVTHDQRAAIDGASVVYAKSWGALSCYGAWDKEAMIRARHQDWTVDEAKLARGDGAVFMHCLPVRRDVVVASAVLDGPRSIVVDQAENRLWTAMSVLLEVLGGSVRREADERGPLLASGSFGSI